MRSLVLAVLIGATIAAGFFILTGHEVDPAAKGTTSATERTFIPTFLPRIEPTEAASPRWTPLSPRGPLPRRPGTLVQLLHGTRGLAWNRGELRKVFSDLALHDRTMAIELALRLPGTADRKFAIETISDVFADQETREGPFRANEPPRNRQRRNPGDPIDRALVFFLMRGNLPRDLTARVAAEYSDEGAFYTTLTARMVSQEAERNPDAAMALSNLLPQQDAAASAIAAGWSRHHPLEALDWVRSLPESGGREEAIGQIAREVARRDVGFAAGLLAEMPESPRRQQTLLDIATLWAGVDTQAALSWAGNLSPVESQRATAAIRNRAPIGVGITLQNQRETGYPTAAGVLPESPASKSGAIRAGDAIVAVADASGGWTSTRNQNLNSVVGLIRGQAGEPVRLQILPAGETNPANARTVTITREQILYKQPQPGLPPS